MRSIRAVVAIASAVTCGWHASAQQRPVSDDASWVIGNAQAKWAISRQTGHVVGGWNAKTGERYLLSLVGRYHVEERHALTTGVESDDVVLSADLAPGEQRLELICSNAAVPDLTISKRYWVRDNKLFQRVAFTTQSDALQFLTYSSQATFDQAYRDGGYYMGGGDGGGPLVPAPQIDGWQKVTAHRNTTKGMVLHQPDRGYSFAHIRTRLDDRFVWPWFTGAIEGYVERQNVLHYTPDGWDMSLGTSRLSQAQEVSYEQYVSVFEGDWQRFLTDEYPALPEVQAAYAEIPPTPDWVGDIKVYASSDIDRLRSIVEMTDEGTIVVIVDFGGNWGDYYVDQGLTGGLGGNITPEETKDLIERIKALSPRIKVGIYMWVLSALEDSRIYRAHPEWFRSTNRDGEPLSTFPGFATNYAHLLSVPECYDELLSQFDLVLGYLGTDFIYLDDPKAINMIDWDSGEYTRDDLSFRFFLDIKRIAARHGPDKMVFFNNMSNPYGDINFVEARSELRAGYWRHFAGIATIAETFLTSQPKARIVPLYYTPPLARDYMNRVLALGWIPSLVYGDALARRAFVQAAYEVGNCTTVPVRYSPDWKRTKDTDIESYAVQRDVGGGYLLSFINHAESRETVPVELDLQTFDIDRRGKVYVWEHAIEDAGKYEGSATEGLSRKTRAETGWQLDRVTRRELVYAGPYRKQLELALDMEPFLLRQLYITDRPAAVYSEDHLPANYLFSRTPAVRLDEMPGSTNRRLKIQVESDRDNAEVALFLPLSSHHTVRVTVDGEVAVPVFTCEGDDVLPVVRVSRGRHLLSVSSRPREAEEPVVVEGLRAAESLTGMRLGLPSHEQALLAIEQGGRTLCSPMVTFAGGLATLQLPAARNEADDYAVSVRAVVDETGELQPARSDPVPFHVSAALPDMGLRSARHRVIQGSQSIVDVNREVNGLAVLRSAAVTTASDAGSMQPDLGALTASVDPDNLVMTAGTTRKIENDARGAAFAGLEIEGLHKVQLRLSNTFHDAFHMRGIGFHVPPRNNSGNFAGLVVDYHTSSGYSKRVRLAAGVLHAKCSSPHPDYGKPGLADETRDLGASLIETPEATFSLDIERHAPDGWDGRVWLSVGSDWIASDRRLTIEILAANDDVSGEFLEGIDPKALRVAYDERRTIEAQRSASGIVIDGSLGEDAWIGAGTTDEFYLIGGAGISSATTTARVAYDGEQLYVGFVCAEPGRRKPLIKGGPAWGDDVVEVWIDANGDEKTFRQVIVNAACDKMEYWDTGPGPIGATAATSLVEGESWSVEMAIPYEGLGVEAPSPGDIWRVSLCRSRPAGRGFGSELIVWAPLQEKGYGDLANFGVLRFR